MKNKYIIIVTIVYLLFGLKVIKNSFVNYYSKDEYDIAVEEFIEIDVDQLEKIERPYFLYVGRKTCPFCVNFVPKLMNAVKEMDTQVYYLNSEKTEFDKKLTEFRKNMK